MWRIEGMSIFNHERHGKHERGLMGMQGGIVGELLKFGGIAR